MSSSAPTSSVHMSRADASGAAKKRRNLARLTVDDMAARGLLKAQRVLMRVDFNVPMRKGTTEISNPQRVVAAVPTIRKVLESGAKCCVLMSHLGRPAGARKPELSLRPVAALLKTLLDREVVFLDDCVGEAAEKASKRRKAAYPAENLRFHAEEKARGRPGDGGEDCAGGRRGRRVPTQPFSSATRHQRRVRNTHRAHSSMIGSNHFNPAGLLLKKELDYSRLSSHRAGPISWAGP